MRARYTCGVRTRTASAPAAAKLWVATIVARAEARPLPANTGTRPAAARTAARTTAAASSSSQCAASPVVPRARKPLIPRARSQSTIGPNASASSRAPASPTNGVGSGTQIPRHASRRSVMLGSCRLRATNATPEAERVDRDSKPASAAPRRLARAEAVLAARLRHWCVVLEDAHDPHNVSAVLRTCEALGIQDVHLVAEAQAESILNPRVTIGAHRWLTLHRHRGAKAAVTALRASGYRIFVSHLD